MSFRLRARSLSLSLVAVMLGTAAFGRAAAPIKKKKKQRHAYRQELHFKSHTDRGQVLSAGEEPPPTTLKDSALAPVSPAAKSDTKIPPTRRTTSGS